jgi:hypothetical protein
MGGSDLFFGDITKGLALVTRHNSSIQALVETSDRSILALLAEYDVTVLERRFTIWGIPFADSTGLFWHVRLLMPRAPAVDREGGSRSSGRQHLSGTPRDC